MLTALCVAAKQLGSVLAYIILLPVTIGMLVGLWFEEKEWFQRTLKFVLDHKQSFIAFASLAGFFILLVVLPVFLDSLSLVDPARQYIQSITASIAAFILAYLLWKSLGTVQYTTVNLRRYSVTDRIDIDWFNVQMFAIVLIVFVLFLDRYATSLSNHDLSLATLTLVLSSSLAILLYFFFQALFASQLSLVREKNLDFSALKKCVDGGKIILPKRIREGESCNITVELSRAFGTSSHPQVELQAAGLKVTECSEQEIADGSLQFVWNCHYPTAGNQVLNLIFKGDYTAGEHYQKLVSHSFMISSIAGRIWPPVLTFSFGVVNIVIAFYNLHIFS